MPRRSNSYLYRRIDSLLVWIWYHLALQSYAATRRHHPTYLVLTIISHLPFFLCLKSVQSCISALILCADHLLAIAILIYKL